MNLIDKIKQLIALAKSEMKVLDDKDALDMLELYPQWQSGKTYVAGDRVQYDGKLWKVLQPHISQESWRPDEVASLFVQVQVDSEQGTIDNPIPYSINMELIEGKYYTQDGVLYRCIRYLAQSVWDLSALVGNYVEVV